MIIFQKEIDLQTFAQKNAAIWSKTGFVPTMGALHAGHISLIEMCKKQAALCIASIFVNPTQFNDPNDFQHYPVTLASDIQMLAQAGCDVLFLPTVAEIYPHGLATTKTYPLGDLETKLEGHYRPGHFQGVCGVVHRLLTIVKPGYIFMGEKDFQQCMVVNKLIELEKLTVRLVTCPTLREKDGLAMSSRNLRLTAKQREIAAGIYREMKMIAQNIRHTLSKSLEENAKKNLIASGFHSVDYVSICHSETLQPVDKYDEKKPIRVLAAAYLGEIRLIDNMGI